YLTMPLSCGAPTSASPLGCELEAELHPTHFGFGGLPQRYRGRCSLRIARCMRELEPAHPEARKSPSGLASSPSPASHTPRNPPSRTATVSSQRRFCSTGTQPSPETIVRCTRRFGVICRRHRVPITSLRVPAGPPSSTKSPSLLIHRVLRLRLNPLLQWRSLSRVRTWLS